VSGAGPVAAADAPVIAAPWPQALPGIWGVPLAGNVAAPAALGGIATAGLESRSIDVGSGAASARGRHPFGCVVDSGAHRRRTPGTRFTVGAGRRWLCRVSAGF